MQGLTVFRSRIFRNLALSYAAVLLFTVLVVGLWVSQRIEGGLNDDIQSTLRAECRLLLPFAVEALGGARLDEIQAEILAMGDEARLRVTIIRGDGVVLGDSHDEPSSMDNHGARPEVEEARTREFGISRRRSRTLGIHMLYVAQAVEVENELLGFVRVSRPLEDLEDQLAQLREPFLLGTAVGLGVALLLGLYLARRFTAPITAMTQVAEGLRAGDYESRVRVVQKDEIGLLGTTLNRLAEEVTDRIATMSQDDAQLRAILASMVEGVVAVDEADRIAFSNDAVRELFELAREEGLVGHAIWEVAPVPELMILLEDVREARAPRQREVTLFRRDKERILTLHASPYRGGGRSGVVVVVHDRTELRHLERVRQDFVANVSHELKTPLTSIKGFVETLLSGALYDEENNERFLRRIEANVERLNHLVSDLLSLARIEGEGGGVAKTDVDWTPIIEEVSRRHEEALRKKGLTYEVESDEVRVRGDREAMVQILDNLLDNAIKYTPAPGRIRVRAFRSESSGVLEVKDTGLGIPAQDLDRVFERFYRVDKARSRAIGGTGLGLSIVKNLLLRMEGDVELESVEGEGSRFRVELPLAS